MKHIDLFSGIGGFALAASWVWGDEYENIAHSDIEKFPCQVYHKHFPESKCLGDITKVRWDEVLTDTRRIGQTECKEQTTRIIECNQIDLITGGFPCQPFSVAGKRRGKEDDRWLWHEMLRAIREVKPRWVIGENVAGIVNVALDEVLSSLEGEGYTTEAFIIPACAVNAPHRRDRVWIVANSQSNRSGGKQEKICRKERRSFNGLLPEFNDTDSHVADTESKRGKLWGGGSGDNPRSQQGILGCNNSHASNCDRERLQGESIYIGGEGEESRHKQFVRRNREWEKSWYEVATELCTLDDGLSAGLVRPKGWRVNSLKALGNAIVPQVVAEIMEAIKAADSKKPKRVGSQ